eukprot:Amastigsp_a682633_11.p3 type:complete len:175 gc:universal Amastigsp_a682633_11:605-81(-)
MPIIIVPPGASASLVTSVNVCEFLETGVFVLKDALIEQYNKENPGKTFRPKPTLKFKIGGSKETRFRVVDNPRLLGPGDWPLVVAVFVLGPLWQFRDFPQGLSTPVELFNAVCGFYVHYADEPVPEAVQKWNVKCLPLQRAGRHRDGAVVASICADMEKFIRMHKRNIVLPSAD